MAQTHAPQVSAALDYADELEQLGRPEAALAEYADLIDAQLCGAAPLMRRADLLRKLERPAEARADLERAAALDLRDGWPHLRLAQMAHGMGKPWLAAVHVQEALNRQPDAPEIRVNAAAIFTSLDWLDRAYATVRPLACDMAGWWGDMRRDSEAAYRALHLQTLAQLRRRRQTPWDNAAAWSLCSALFKLGRLTAARHLCESLMRGDPAAFTAFEAYARMAARWRGPPEAASFLRAIGFLHRDTPGYGESLRWMESQIAF